MTDAQRRLLAAFEVALPYLPDDVCDAETQRYMALPARLGAESPKPCDLEERRHARELGAGAERSR